MSSSEITGSREIMAGMWIGTASLPGFWGDSDLDEAASLTPTESPIWPN